MFDVGRSHFSANLLQSIRRKNNLALMPDRPLTDPGVRYYLTGLFGIAHFRTDNHQAKSSICLSSYYHPRMTPSPYTYTFAWE